MNYKLFYIHIEANKHKSNHENDRQELIMEFTPPGLRLRATSNGKVDLISLQKLTKLVFRKHL